MKQILTLFCALLILTMSVTAANLGSLPVFLNKVEIEHTQVFPNDFTQLDLERNQEFSLRLELEPFADVQNVQIRASISGYEFNDVKPINSEIGPFDFKENVTYIKQLKLTLPDDVSIDSYKLRVELTDRDHAAVIEEFPLKIDTVRHALVISDITYNPGNSVKAGSALLSRVRVENKGQKTEKDVKVTLSIPALNLQAAHYLDTIKSEKQEETEEFFLRVPPCAQPGTYDISAVVSYNKEHDKITKAGTITVVQNEQCGSDKTNFVVTTPNQPQPLVVEAPKENTPRLALEVVLAILIGLLIIVAVVVGITQLRE